MLMYSYEEDPRTEFTLETAMGLYGLENFELLWERATDTKALMAWNADTLVLGFRGTASMANVLADLQARTRQDQFDSKSSQGSCKPSV